MKIYVRRFVMLFVAALIVFMTGLSAAQAASPHFKKNGEPVCTISATGAAKYDISCRAVLAGLGNADLVAKLSVSGSALYTCQNNGGQQAPGQNKVLVGPATSSTSIPASDIKNGNLTLVTNPATLTAPATVSAAAAGCPNNNWTGVNPVVTVTSITLVIEQPPTVAIFTCSASNPNGLSSPVTLSC